MKEIHSAVFRGVAHISYFVNMNSQKGKSVLQLTISKQNRKVKNIRNDTDLVQAFSKEMADYAKFIAY